MTKNQRIKEIKHEIEWYGIKKRIADAMLELGELGFEFSGHGCGFGGEDFSLTTKNLYVNFCDKGRKVVMSVNDNDEGMDVVFEGTIGAGLKFIRNKS